MLLCSVNDASSPGVEQLPRRILAPRSGPLEPESSSLSQPIEGRSLWTVKPYPHNSLPALFLLSLSYISNKLEPPAGLDPLTILDEDSFIRQVKPMGKNGQFATAAVSFSSYSSTLRSRELNESDGPWSQSEYRS